MARPADPNAKEALLAAARAEFANNGLLGARIEDITAACGLSKGAFYLHFPSKESLFGDLVGGFFSGLGTQTETRHKAMLRFFKTHPSSGAAKSRALDGNSLDELLALETQLDLEALELMWSFRDVLGVLINGCQGTRFEGAVWEMVDREMARLKQSFDEFKQHKACRTDIPFEVLGSMIIGTYLLIGMRMSRAAQKPDLLQWARSLHVLLREGNAPSAQHGPARQHLAAPQSPAPKKTTLPRSTPSKPTKKTSQARTRSVQ